MWSSSLTLLVLLLLPQSFGVSLLLLLQDANPIGIVHQQEQGSRSKETFVQIRHVPDWTRREKILILIIFIRFGLIDRKRLKGWTTSSHLFASPTVESRFGFAQCLETAASEIDIGRLLMRPNSVVESISATFVRRL
jgi:hypothetical protein